MIMKRFILIASCLLFCLSAFSQGFYQRAPSTLKDGPRKTPSRCNDPYGDGQDSFDLTALAGDPRLPGLFVTILKNYFGFQDNSKFCAHTYCEVDYFRKDPEDAGNSG